MKVTAYLVTALVACAAVAAAVVDQSKADATATKLTLTFRSVDADWTHVADVGPPGDSPGDGWFFRDSLVNVRPQLGLPAGAAAGHSEGSIRTLGRGIEDSVWTAFLPNGTIVVGARIARPE